MPVSSKKCTPLSDIVDENSDSALHLLCKGKFTALKKLVSDKVIRNELSDCINKGEIGKAAECLLDNGCSLVVQNNKGFIPVQMLLDDFWQIYNKPLDNDKYAQILNVFMHHRHMNDYVKQTLCKKQEYIRVLTHYMTKSEVITEDMEQMVHHFRQLEERSLAIIILEIFEILLKSKVPVNPDSLCKWLHKALVHSNEAHLRATFLELGIQNAIGDLFSKRRCNKMIRFMLSYHFPDSGETLLHLYVQHGKLPTVSAMLSSDPQVASELLDGEDKMGRRAIHLCDTVEALQVLVDTHCMDPNVADNTGITVSMFLASNGLFAVIKRMMECYPDNDFSKSSGPGQENILFSIAKGVVFNGNISEAVLLLPSLFSHNFKIDINHQNKDGQTALMSLFHWLCSGLEQNYVSDSMHLALSLINDKDFQIDVKDHSKQCATMYALKVLSCNQSEHDMKIIQSVILRLLDKINNFNNHSDKYNRSILVSTINLLNNITNEKQQTFIGEIITEILKMNNVEINKTDSEDRTALMHAIFNRSPSTVQVLIAKGADINVADETGQTASMYALIYDCSFEHLIEKKQLLLNVPDNRQNILLHTAIKYEKFEAIEDILKQEVDIGLMHENIDGQIPLYAAIASEICTDRILHKLLEDPRYELLYCNKAGESVLEIFEKYPLKRSAAVENILQKKFLEMIKQVHWTIQSLRFAIKLNSVQCAQDKYGKTAAMFAAEHMQSVDLCLICSENVNIKDDLGQSIVNYLLEFEVYDVLIHVLNTYEHTDIYNKDNNRQSALLVATLKAPLEVLQVFFKHDMDLLRIEEEPTRTTLDMFVEKGRKDSLDSNVFEWFHAKMNEQLSKGEWSSKMVKLLTKMPFYAQFMTDVWKESALNFTLKEHNFQLALQVLQNVSCDVNHKDRNGYTPLFKSIISFGKEPETNDLICEVIKKLLQHSLIDVNICALVNETALTIAICNSNKWAISKLLMHRNLQLKAMVGPSTEEEKILSAIGHKQSLAIIELIIRTQDGQLLQMLVNHENFCINDTQLSDGATLMHSIIQEKWLEGLNILLQCDNLMLNIEDENKKTPLFLAIHHLPAKHVKGILEHRNCDAQYRNFYGGHALSYLDELLKDKEDEEDNINMKRLIEYFTENNPMLPFQSVRNIDDFFKQVEEMLKQISTHLSKDEKKEIRFHTELFGKNIKAIINQSRGGSDSHHKQYQMVYIMNYETLVKEMEIGEIFLAHFVKNKIITMAETEEIAESVYRTKKVRCLIHKIMYRGEKGLSVLKHALRECGQGHLADDLEKTPIPCLYKASEK